MDSGTRDFPTSRTIPGIGPTRSDAAAYQHIKPSYAAFIALAGIALTGSVSAIIAFCRVRYLANHRQRPKISRHPRTNFLSTKPELGGWDARYEVDGTERREEVAGEEVVEIDLGVSPLEMSGCAEEEGTIRWKAEMGEGVRPPEMDGGDEEEGRRRWRAEMVGDEEEGRRRWKTEMIGDTGAVEI